MKPAFPSLQTFNPPGSEILRRVYSPAPGQMALAVGVMVPFALHAPDAQPGDLAPIWDTIAKVLGKDGVLDEAWPKARGELLAAGCCHPPAGHHQQPVSARISAGTIDKRLAVFGERHYGLGGRISSPLAFDSMPLTLAQAFGGLQDPTNPEGKGLDTTDGAQLPNVELPDALIAKAGDRPGPAGFGPLPVTHPQRAHYLGAHGPEWLKERWPHLPLETDPRFFQSAPADQWLEGFWAGGEAVMVRNMHPDHPDLVGRTPQLRPRFFIHQTQADSQVRFLELKAHADTVWLLPGASLGLMIYRALAPVSTSDARDVNAFLAEFEDTGTAALPTEYYVDRCLRNMAPQAFENIPDPIAVQQAHASLSNEELSSKVREQKALFKQMLQDQGLDEAHMLEELSANPHTRKLAQLISQRSGSLSGFFNEIESLLGVIEGKDGVTPPVGGPTLESVLPPPVATAPQAPATPPEPQHVDALRDEALAAHHRQAVLYRIGHGLPCAGLDLTQANLAGLDLAGADFTGSLLAGANLAGAQLQGARLQEANLQGARLDAANLAGCQLAGATLDQASFVGAVLKGAVLDGSDCTQANFSGTDLSGISLRQATLAYAWLGQVRATQLAAEGADFSHANLEGADLSRATLNQANFTGARLHRAVLDDASCAGVNFTQADLGDASLARCDLSASQSTPGSRWNGANLQQAILNDASWMGASLEGARMPGIKALKADLSDTDLRHAQIPEADLRKAVFDRADLGHANLGRCNLMEASFIHADLGHCRLDDSNLYGATFIDTILTDASLKGANLDGTILKIRAQA